MKHNKYFFLILLSLALLSPAVPENDDELKVKIIYPLSNEVLSMNGKNIFILGQINIQNAILKVNNTDANIDDDGAFISYSPVILFEENGITKGKFIFEATVGSKTLTSEKIYNIKQTFRELLSDTLEIDLDYPISPGQNISLKVGDILEVELRASPGSQITFSIEGMMRYSETDSRELIVKFPASIAVPYALTTILRTPQSPLPQRKPASPINRKLLLGK